MLNERLGGAVQQIELAILDHDDVRPPEIEVERTKDL